MLTAVRALNRLELVGETLRHTLNVLAEVAPEWVRALVTPEWFEWYSRRIEEYRLPKGQEARQHYAELIGADGAYLLAALDGETTLTWLRDLPAVLILRQVWKQQYVRRDDRLWLRKAEELPPSGERTDSSWQAREQTGYDVSHFQIDWQARQAVCPQGHVNSSWTPHQDAWGNEVIAIKFSRTDCRLCPVRTRCNKAAESPRHMTVRPQMGHEALVRIRTQQETTEWKERYDQRAGIEGTLSQSIRLMQVRQARSVGVQKVRLQHVATAVALTMLRISAWLEGTTRAKTRTSRFAALALAS